MSGSAAISENQPMLRTHLPHFLQLLDPKRLLAQPLFYLPMQHFNVFIVIFTTFLFFILPTS
jgi:hypothetical protein